MAGLIQIWTALSIYVAVTAGFPQQYQNARQAYQQQLGQYQITPASTSNNLNDGVRYGQQQQPAVMFLMPGQINQQQYLAALQQPQSGDYAQDEYLESLLASNYPAAQEQYYDRAQLVQQFLPQQLPQKQAVAVDAARPSKLQSLAGQQQQQQQLYLEQQLVSQEDIQRLQDQAAERQKYGSVLQQYYQQRPSSNFVLYSLPQQQVFGQGASALSDRGQHHGLRPSSLGLQSLQRLQLRSGQEQNNASESAESQETTQAPQSNEEVGPSIAQAKPQAISVAGPGGVAAAAPVGTAVVGPGGMALSAPTATALAGTKPKPGQTPGASNKLRQAIRYLY